MEENFGFSLIFLFNILTNDVSLNDSKFWTLICAVTSGLFNILRTTKDEGSTKFSSFSAASRSLNKKNYIFILLLVITTGTCCSFEMSKPRVHLIKVTNLKEKKQSFLTFFLQNFTYITILITYKQRVVKWVVPICK